MSKAQENEPMRQAMMDDGKPRCNWIGNDEAMRRYHDDEWGVAVHDDRKWFEYLVLDAFQAGLSWRTVLHKREALRQVFCGFDPELIVRISDRALSAALENKAIIRNRLKIQATVDNARAFLKLQQQKGSFDAFIWSFTENRTIHNSWRSTDQIPAATSLSDRISKSLKQAGFSFAGTTICYSLLQAGGIINDHLMTCFRHAELRG